MTITEISQALFKLYAAKRGENDAYTLTGGRFYRTQAPTGALRPYIVVAFEGGEMQRTFAQNTVGPKPMVRIYHLRFAVIREFADDASNADIIWDSLAEILDLATPDLLGPHVGIEIMQTALPTETVEEGSVMISAPFQVIVQVQET